MTGKDQVGDLSDEDHGLESSSIVRLGTITLPCSTIRRDIQHDEWIEINREDLIFDAPKAYDEIVTSLRHVLSDAGIGFRMSGFVKNKTLVIRISGIPRDAPESQWDFIQATSQRKKSMKIVFQWLESGWDGGGHKLIQTVNRLRSGEAQNRLM